MTGLEKIIDKIIADAKVQADAITCEAKEKCDAISAEAEEKKVEIHDRIYNSAILRGEVIKNNAMSNVAMNKRDAVLELKGRLTDEAFASAVKEILALDEDKYRMLMTQLLCKCLAEQLYNENESLRLYGENISPDVYEVILNKKDKELHGSYIIAGVRRSTVGRLTSEILDKIKLSDKVADIDGGIILKCGAIEINCSFGVIAAELRAKLEGEVLQVLFPPEKEEE